MASRNPGWLKKTRSLVDLRRAFADFCLCAGDVFAILTTTGVGTVSGSHKRECALHSIILHLAQGVRRASDANCDFPNKRAGSVHAV